MIAIYLDPETNKYTRQIKFTLEYLLNMSGYSWKYLSESVEPAPNDVILYYSAEIPDKQYLDWMVNNFTFIHIPFVKEFYIPGFFSGENLKNNIRTMKLEINIPFISTRRILNSPIQFIEQGQHKYGILLFDIIGNVFFHISDDDRNHLKTKDKQEHLNFSELGFKDYFNIPYINYYIEIFYMTIAEIIQTNRQWTLKRCLYPANQHFAAIISHNVDSLQKWNLLSIIISPFTFLWYCITFRLGYFFKNLWSMWKYIFTNVEDYWNLYDISAIERKHKFPSTFFVGVRRNKKKLFDYEFDEPEVLKELQEISIAGSELALLFKSTQTTHTAPKTSPEEIKKCMDTLSSRCRVAKTGVRHIDFYGEVESFDKYAYDVKLKYDSSRRLPDKNGFYNGFALPYPLYIKNLINPTHTVYELPITFTDELLKINKYENLSYNEAIEALKTLVKIVTRTRGVFHLQTTNSLFSDIKYMPKFHDYFIDHLRTHNAYVTSCSGMIDWFEKRNLIDIEEKENVLILKFHTNIDQITFEFVGNATITNVYGGNNTYKKNIVQFINVIAGLEVEILIAPTEFVEI